MRLAMDGRVRALQRDASAQRRLEWHVLRPHADKGFPSLDKWLGTSGQDVAEQTPDQIANVMAAYAVGGGITRTYPPGHPLHKPIDAKEIQHG